MRTLLLWEDWVIPVVWKDLFGKTEQGFQDWLCVSFSQRQDSLNAK